MHTELSKHYINEHIFFDDSRHKNNDLFDYNILSDLDSVFCVHLSVGGCLMDFHTPNTG